MSDELLLSGTVRAPQGSASVAGYRVAGSLIRRVKVGSSRADTVDLPASGSGFVGPDGHFTAPIPGEGTAQGPLEVTVFQPDGTKVLTQQFTLEEASVPLTLRVPALPPLVIATSGDSSESITLNGRVIDSHGTQVKAGLPVVLWGSESGNGAPHPLVVTKTQAGGYFSGDWVSKTLISAFGRVAGSASIEVPLEDERLPRRVLLVLEVPDTDTPSDDHTPRLPGPADLTSNPAAYSQDLGRGCVDLCTPNRVIEEFIYSMVVRTSEPDIKGLTLGVKRIVPPRVLATLVEASTMHEVALRGSVNEEHVAALKGLSLDVESARILSAGDQPPSLAEIKRAAWLSEVSRVKDLIGVSVSPATVRQALDADHPIDWDDTPTIYQAISIARGHVLQFREVWRADGYSLGDLLYSLPLAPGQRRQVAIVDWERRSTTTREEALEFEEQLDAFIARDRDVAEIVGSRLSEESAGASRNTTWGASGGIGAGFIGTGFGIFGGVSGSSGGSSSSAWQESSRRFTGDSLQSLRDRVMQRASSVRDQSSSVVQTASQGETLRAETETVANYNHCHAMTVEYFEVLRHFVITHELADVRECLFVPMPMSEFTPGKALRWQTPLVAHLRDRALLPGFDAIRRIADNWEGWDYPQSRYSEESPQYLDGELRISFVLPRPRDAADGAFQVAMWDGYRPLLWMDPFELWTKYLQQATAQYNAEEIAKRDREFREKIAPELAQRVMDRLHFWYVTATGEEEVKLDATLVSRYSEGAPLYVTLRPNGELPAIPREQIVQFKITTEGAGLPADAQVIVHSGKVRYQTEHKTWLLFKDDRILNDLSNTDAVYIATPTSWEETRNPRQEDRALQARVIDHLNSALEYYHQVIWTWLDDQRRFMLLDGILVPGLGGKSVASVVENRLIGIAGNSLILPLAPGIRIDPRVSGESKGDLIDLYAVDSPAPLRVSVPTRGVYAEAVLGHCGACEEIDDSRYWRWTDAGMLAPPEIEKVGTESRTDGEQPLKETALPKPLVSIQNAPDLPAPVGLGEVFKLLARPDLFPDITGLAGTQKNAKAGFDAALSAVSGVAETAAGLAKQNIASREGERMLDRIQQAQKDGLLTPGVAQDLSTKVFGTMVGAPDEKSDKKASSPVSDPTVQKALDKVAQSDTGAVKVSTLDESVELSFEGGDVGVGGGGTPAVLDLEHWMDEPVIFETFGEPTPGNVVRGPTTTIDKIAPIRTLVPAALIPKFIRPKKVDPTGFELFGRLRVVYPGDPKDPKKVAGRGRLPLAVLVHGNHFPSWLPTEVRSHDGYSYLQDDLARRGIISVSVDTNAANFFDSAIEMRARIIIRAIETMRAQDKDATSRLSGRINFDKVGLMGHSRGGDGVVKAALLNSGNKHCVIRAVALLAPPDMTGRLPQAQRHMLTGNETEFLLVVYGGLDGDMAGFFGAKERNGTGFRHYDRTDAPAAMVYIPSCGHNRFNQTWIAAGEDPFTLAPDIARLHSKTDHEQLLKDYVGGLFEWKLLGVAAKSSLFNGKATNSLGHPVSLQWNWGAQRLLIDNFEKPTASTIGPRTVNGVDVGPFEDIKVGGNALAPNTGHQTAIAATLPTVLGPQQLAIEIDVPTGQRDWSGFQLLTFRLGTSMDVSSETAIKNAVSPPPFFVILIDGANKVGVIPSTAFTTPDLPGKPVFHMAKNPNPNPNPSVPLPDVNCTFHRLATVAVPLSKFGVNLKDVRKLQIEPGSAFNQRIFFDSLLLVTP